MRNNILNRWAGLICCLPDISKLLLIRNGTLNSLTDKIVFYNSFKLYNPGDDHAFRVSISLWVFTPVGLGH